jgi:mono/diheme cytochrome c family protein
MKVLKMGLAAWILATVAIALLSLSQPAKSADAPAPTFAKEVKPFLQNYCISCHGANKPKAGINLESYDKLINGGKSLVKIGKPDDSRLCQVCEGKGKPMPPKKSKQPTADEIKSVRAWIADGAKNN